MIEDTVKTFLERSDIQNLLTNAEKQKKKLLIKMGFFVLICIVLFIANLLFIGIPIIGIGIFLFYLKKLDPRITVMSQISMLIDPDFSYMYKTNIFPIWIKDKKLLGDYENFDGASNYIKYKIKKVGNVGTCDILLEGIRVTTSSGRGKYRQVVCDAFITEIKLPNGILGIHTDVSVKAERGSLIPVFEDSKTFGVTKNKVFLESGDFEKMFDVYSSDQIKAREVLNPHTMETLMHFIKSFEGGRSYDFLFTKDSIFIKYDLLRSKDKSIFVSPNLMNNFTKDTKIFSDFYNEFLRLKAFIADFDPFYKI